MLGQQAQMEQQQHHQQGAQQHKTFSSQSSSNTSSNHTHHQHLVNHRTSSANQKPSADDDYLDDQGMRIGNNYQAEIPQFIALAPAPEYYEDEKAIRVWSPHNKIPDHVLEAYIAKAKDKFYYNIEQALGMLSWHKFDLNRAYADLPNFVPYPNEWSVEDKVLFEQAYQFHEKQFHKIKQMLPDKSMANLINYYYSWKKTRTRPSLMERQTRRFAARRNADSNAPSDEDDDADDEPITEKVESREKDDSQPDQPDQEGSCNSPGDPGGSDPLLNLTCVRCATALRADGKNKQVILHVRTLDESVCEKCFFELKLETKDKGDALPAETYVNTTTPVLFSYSDVVSLIEGTPEQGDIMLKCLDSQIQDKRREIQTKKQTLSQINEKIQPVANQIAELDTTRFRNILPEYKPRNDGWSQEEIQLLLQGLRRYGTDFGAISDIIRTKSPESIKTFYVAQKERLQLDVLVSEFERGKEDSTLPSLLTPDHPVRKQSNRAA